MIRINIVVQSYNIFCTFQREIDRLLRKLDHFLVCMGSVIYDKEGM